MTICAISSVSTFLTLASRPTLLWLKRALADFPAERPISVLDVGMGGGGMLRKLRKWARGKNLKLDLRRVGVTPWSTRSTAEATPPEMSINFETADRPRSNGFAPDRFYRQFVFHPSPRRRGSGSFYPLDGPLCRAWLVHQDLQRHILPYFFIRYATRFLPVNRMARHNEPVSVARAFAADAGGTCWLKPASRQSGRASNGSFPFATACHADKRSKLSCGSCASLA